jgi:hypothetical protein
VRGDDRYRWPLPAILAVALLARIAVAYFAGFSWFTPDSHGYLAMADSILAGTPESHFPNGYPLLIVGVKLLAPEAAVPAVLMAINVALSSAVVGLVYLLGRKLHPNPTVGLLASAIVALYPNQLVYLHYLLSEVPTQFLLVGSILALVSGRAGWGGASLALACAFRSTLLPVLPAALALVAWHDTRRGAWLRMAAGCAAVGAAYGLLLVSDVIAPSRNLSSNLSLAISDTSSGFSWSTESITAEQRANPWAAYASFAWQEPGAFLLQRASSLWELWGPYPLDTPRAVWENMLIGLRFPLLLMALAGAWHGRRRPEILLTLAPVLVLSAVHVAFFSVARFAYVVMPLVIVLAAVWLVPALHEHCGRRTRPRDSERGL